MRRSIHKLTPFAAALVACCLCAHGTRAETVITGDAFEEMSTGKVMRFSQDGAYYGAEQFYEGRRSTWQYADGSCVDGIWYEEPGAICFDYEDASPAQCWVFAQREGGFFARLRGSAATAPGQLELFSIDETPLTCAGPDLGV
ncbi:MAG: hypothetical protein AAFR93_01750 [Pseudomonadota bacterium]